MVTVAVGTPSRAQDDLGATKLDTFAFNNQITIQDNSNAVPYGAPIRVRAMPGVVTEVTIRIRGMNHQRPSDIDIMLVSPQGTAVVVMSDVGGDDALQNTTITIDDNAATPIPAMGPILSTSYQPTNVNNMNDNFGAPAPTPNGTDMAAFDGLSGTGVNGIWRLYVRDKVQQIGGNIANGWSITVRTTNSDPIAQNDHYRVKADEKLVVRRPGVLRNDRDPDGDRLRASLVTKPEKGSVTLNRNGSFRYIPDDNASGTDRFVYQVSDQNNLTDRAKVTIKIT